MADVTVRQFAEVLKIPVERLLVQLDAAGLGVSDPDAMISEDSKMALLTHLQGKHGKEAAKGDALRPKITLKRKSQTELKVSSGQGRARTVAVEVKKKRTYIKRDVLEKEAADAQAVLDKERADAEAKAARDKAAIEQEAARRADEKRQQEEAAAKAETERKEAEDAARKAQEAQVNLEAAKPAEAAKAAPARKDVPARKDTGRRDAKDTRYGRKELHVAQGRGRDRKKRKKTQPRRRRAVSVETTHGFEMPTAPLVREVAIPEAITVSELAQRMAVKGNDVIRIMMGLGVMATINQTIDQDTATIIVEEMGHEPKLIRESEIEAELLETKQVDAEEVARAPVVTIMGHVDHGKTSLLDRIRKTQVAEGEAGGITQHIGAYRVKTDKGIVTFLDTPGHEAFTAMRARGAQVTDIVVLVVAADDGVKPQTVEAIKHAKAAEVNMIVAINKVDKPDADLDRVKNELSAQEVIPEDWGGDTIFCPVSAKTGDGIDALLDSILLQAEVLELKAVVEGPASGVVIESSLEKGRGAVATVLVNRGTLKAGDFVLAGTEFGRVRAMFDEHGDSISSAGPSVPVAVLGLSGAPAAGDDVLAVENERKAREVAELRHSKRRDVKIAREQATSLEDVFSQMKAGERRVVTLLIKADVQGSSEALRDSLSKLSNDEIDVKVVYSGVGGITESDINLAVTSGAIVIGFNVRADAAARAAVKESGVDLHYYSVIYDAIDEVKKAISGMLSPEIKEQIVGLAQVREVFRSPKFGQIAGCMVIEGFVKRNFPIRVLRDNVVIYEGELESLRRFKDDVSEVRAGTECGIGVRNYNDVKDGDQIECFERVEVARQL